MKKSILFLGLVLCGLFVVLVSSSFKPANPIVPNAKVTCTGTPCEDANGLVYNTRNPLFGTKICCGVADSDRGSQDTSN